MKSTLCRLFEWQRDQLYRSFMKKLTTLLSLASFKGPIFYTLSSWAIDRSRRWTVLMSEESSDWLEAHVTVRYGTFKYWRHRTQWRTSGRSLLLQLCWWLEPRCEATTQHLSGWQRSDSERTSAPPDLKQTRHIAFQNLFFFSNPWTNHKSSPVSQ